MNRFNWLFGADMQQEEAALRRVLHAGQRQRYAAMSRAPE
jgi:hypothetical protein